MSKKCTPLWRKANSEVKMYKADHVRTTFGSCDVEKVSAVVARSTFRSQNGNRIVPTLRGSTAAGGIAVPPLDDEMGEEPLDDVEEETVPPTPILTLFLFNLQLVWDLHPQVLLSVIQMVQDRWNQLQYLPMLNFMHRCLKLLRRRHPAPSLGLPGPATPLEMLRPAVETVGMEVEDTTEPSAKRQKLSVLRVGDEELFHMDVDNDEYLADAQFSEFAMEATVDVEMSDLQEPQQNEMSEDDLWQPFSQFEPELSSEELQRVDDFADTVEIQRLFGMTVLCKHEDYKGELGTQLSAKFVRTWRKKTRVQFDAEGKVVSSGPAWLRRSRVVAREYNWLDVRDDVYSPSSSAAIVKLLPALAMSNSFCEQSVLGTLDIGDAFLQVPQSTPRVVRLGSTNYVILKCLPGQRDASKLWYQFFVEKLQKLFGASVCKEQPCVLKVERKVAMVMHVDDILSLGEQGWICETFLPGLEQEFRLTSSVVDRQKGGSFEFLKRLHVVEPGYAGMTVFPESKHVHTMYDRFAKANGKPAKLSKTPSAPSSSTANVSSQQPLSESMAAEYRSLVGLAMYVSQQRFDIQYTVKTLASSLKSPSTGAWFELGRLVGYLKLTESHALEMQQTVKGCSFLGSVEWRLQWFGRRQTKLSRNLFRCRLVRQREPTLNFRCSSRLKWTDSPQHKPHTEVHFLVEHWIRVVCSQCWNMWWTLPTSHCVFLVWRWCWMPGATHGQQCSQNAFSETWCRAAAPYQRQIAVAAGQSCSKWVADQAGEDNAEHSWLEHKGIEQRPLLLLAVHVWVCCEWRKGWCSWVHQNADPWPLEAASEGCERGCFRKGTSNAWFKAEQDSKASATRFGVMQFDVSCRRWKRCSRRCFSWKLLEGRHQWSLGSLATAVEPNDHDVFCLRFHATAWMGDVHGTRWKKTRTRRWRWTRARARTSSRTTHFQIPNEQHIIRSRLCKCDQWSNVQSWRNVGMDVSSMRSTSVKEHQSRCQWVSHGYLTTDDTSVLLLWRDERQWVPKHAGQCGCDDGLDRWRKFSSSSDVNGWKRNRDLSSFPSLPSWSWLGEADSQCRKSTKWKCKCRWNYSKCRDELRVFWIRKPSRAAEKVFAHTVRSFWPRTLDGDTPWRMSCRHP